MKRTNILRLQMPEPGDEYSSNTLTQNVNTLNRVMANIGGNTPRREFFFPSEMSAVLTPTENVTVTGGSFVVFGDGMAYMEVNFTCSINLGTDSMGRLNSVFTVANVNPEFDIAVNSPMTSGGLGMALQGYYAANPPRLRVQALKGYSSNNQIPAGTQMQLAGYFPLKNVPKNIGLEQMNPARFDYEVHNRNVLKLDAVAGKLKRKVPSGNLPPIIPAAGVTITSGVFHRNSNGWITMSIGFNRSTAINTGSNGDFGNTVIGQVPAGYWPSKYTKLVSTGTGPMLVGEINPSTGVISLSAGTGNGRVIAANSALQIVGDWPAFDGD